MATGHNSFEDVPWINTLVDFVAKILKQNRIRTIGVCFGHQIVGRAMGAKVGRSGDGWEASVDDIDLLPRGKQLFNKERLVIGFTFPCFKRPGDRAPHSDMPDRVCTRCIATSSIPIQQVWNRLARAHCAASKACTRRAMSSRYRAIQSSTRRS